MVILFHMSTPPVVFHQAKWSTHPTNHLSTYAWVPGAAKVN